MPKYHLISDLLNDLNSTEGGIWIDLLGIIKNEWNSGNIKIIIRCTKDGSLKILEPLNYEITLTKLTSAERWIRCIVYPLDDWGVLAGPGFENPFITDEDVQYVMRRAAELELLPAEQLNGTEIQPSQPSSAALSTQGEVSSEATVARTVSLDELKEFVRGSEHQSENALWDEAKDAFHGKNVPRRRIREAIEAVRGRPGRTGRPKKSPEETRRN